MNEYMVWLIIGIVICLLVFIGVPLLGKIIREKDFKDQVSGKKPERKAPSGFRTGESAEESVEIQNIKESSRLKSMQNLFGPK